MGKLKVIMVLVSLFSLSLAISAAFLINGIMKDDAIDVGNPEPELESTRVTKITISVKIPNEGFYPVSPKIKLKIYKSGEDELVGSAEEKFTISGRSEKEVNFEISIEDSFQTEMATYDGQLDLNIKIEGRFAWIIPIPAQEVEKTVDYNGPL